MIWSKIKNNSLYSLYAEIWQGIVGSGASNTLTIAWDNSNFMTAYVCEYSGVGNVDVTPAVNQNISATPDTGTTSPTTQANELWIGAINLQYSTQSNPTNGFTLIADNNLGWDSCNGIAYLQKIVSAQGAADCSTTGSASNVWAGCIATFKAASAQSYSLTISVTPTGSGTTSPAAGTYNNITAGTNESVTANANSGYSFSYWTLDGSNVGNANPYGFQMNSNHTLQAVFVTSGGSLSASPPLQLSGNVISIPQANGSTNGYLSSSDWSTFNNKQSALTTGNLTGTNVNVTGGTGAIIGSGITLSIPQNIDTGASPTFTGLTINGNAGMTNLNVTSGLTFNGSAGSSGQVLTSNGLSSAPTWQTVSSGSGSYTGTDGVVISGSAISLDSSYSPTFAGLTINGQLSLVSGSYFNLSGSGNQSDAIMEGDFWGSGNAGWQNYNGAINFMTNGSSFNFIGSWGGSAVATIDSSGDLKLAGNMTLGTSGNTLSFYTPAQGGNQTGTQLNLQAINGMSQYPVLQVQYGGLEADDIIANGVLWTSSLSLNPQIGGGAILMGHGYTVQGDMPTILLADPNWNTLWVKQSQSGVALASLMPWGDIMLGNLFAFGDSITPSLSETAFEETNVRLGICNGTPRIIFQNGGYTQWEIDNGSGSLRFYNPGTPICTMTTSAFYTNNTSDLGTSSDRWNKLYCVNGYASSGFHTGDLFFANDLEIYRRRRKRDFTC